MKKLLAIVLVPILLVGRVFAGSMNGYPVASTFGTNDFVVGQNGTPGSGSFTTQLYPYQNVFFGKFWFVSTNGVSMPGAICTNNLNFAYTNAQPFDTVWVSPGQYYSPWNDVRCSPNVTVIGAGKYNTIWHFTNAVRSVLNSVPCIEPASGEDFSGMGIACDGYTNVCAAIGLIPTSLAVSNCYFHSIYTYSNCDIVFFQCTNSYSVNFESCDFNGDWDGITPAYYGGNPLYTTNFNLSFVSCKVTLHASTSQNQWGGGQCFQMYGNGGFTLVSGCYLKGRSITNGVGHIQGISFPQSGPSPAERIVCNACIFDLPPLAGNFDLNLGGPSYSGNDPTNLIMNACARADGNPLAVSNPQLMYVAYGIPTFNGLSIWDGNNDGLGDLFALNIGGNNNGTYTVSQNFDATTLTTSNGIVPTVTATNNIVQAFGHVTNGIVTWTTKP
ncbi:MAG TPA: hypothetical protein VK742_08360 [Candidatus Sulfotelmatobacter sp.]|jgi:hypothetical protein|nr:hypothetical protein [Candidatus Sulfotelmatobacter sp.]